MNQSINKPLNKRMNAGILERMMTVRVCWVKERSNEWVIQSIQEPITRSEHLPYLLLELSFLQTELFLERLSRQANNAFVYWPTRALHYFCNKWINYLDFPTFINMADSSDEFESDLSCESKYESVESSDEWEPITDSLNLIRSTANCTLNLPLRKHIFFAGNSKLKITRSVKTISQPKRERCSLLVMGSWSIRVRLSEWIYKWQSFNSIALLLLPLLLITIIIIIIINEQVYQ